MDLNEYHRAWMEGHSERECVRRGEEKWMEDREMEKHYRKQEEQYFRELERQIEADILAKVKDHSPIGAVGASNTEPNSAAPIG
jgi:hypothetical protein